MKKSAFCVCVLTVMLAVFAVFSGSIVAEPAKAATDIAAYDALITFDVIDTGSFYQGFTLNLGTYAGENGQTAKSAATYLQLLFGDDWTYTVDPTSYVLTMYRQFDSVTDYYVALGRDGWTYEESDSIVVKKAFFIYSTNQDVTMFESSAGTPVQFLVEVAKSAGIADSDILYAFRYGVKYKKMVTSDADEVVAYPNYNLHVFYVAPDNLGRTYTMTYKNVNSATWYIIAIAAGGLVAVVSATAIAVNKKKQGEVYYG